MVWQGASIGVLGEFGVPLSSVRSFVADSTGATCGEDGGRASRCPWVDILGLRYSAALLHSFAAEIDVPAQHNSGSQSPVAKVQARSDTRAKQRILAAENGGVPFREWRNGHFYLGWRGVLAADPSAVLEAGDNKAVSFCLSRARRAIRCVGPLC